MAGESRLARILAERAAHPRYSPHRWVGEEDIRLLIAVAEAGAALREADLRLYSTDPLDEAAERSMAAADQEAALIALFQVVAPLVIE